MFPGLTRWEKAKFCGVCTASYVPVLDRWFCGTWEVEWIVPLIVVSLAFSSFGVFHFLVMPFLSNQRFWWYFLLIFLMVFLYCYYRTIRDGPGVWPFYWSEMEEHPELPREHDSLSGIISMDLQYQWAKDLPRPPRSTLAKSARRYVLRPDHECCYTTSWIGKRNHKFFILFNFYGFIYLSCFTILCVLKIGSVIDSNTFSFEIACLFIYGVLGANFTMTTGFFFLQSVTNTLKGVTEWEKFKELFENSPFDRGWRRNLEDVFGTSWYCWLLPTSPWTGMTNEQLARNYIPYANI